MKFQRIFSFGGNLFDWTKLSNPDRVMTFLKEMKELLEINDAALYVLGASPMPENPHGEVYIKGGAVGSSTSILIDTIPAKTELHVEVFFDTLSKETQDEVVAAAEKTFR